MTVPCASKGKSNSSIWKASRTALAGRTAIALCRCGHSANKPFCDGLTRLQASKTSSKLATFRPRCPSPKVNRQQHYKFLIRPLKPTPAASVKLATSVCQIGKAVAVLVTFLPILREQTARNRNRPSQAKYASLLFSVSYRIEIRSLGQKGSELAPFCCAVRNGAHGTAQLGER